jgi:hypothetical protein
MRKQVMIAALAFAAVGASAQTRMEATGPFTYEALGATPTLKIRGPSSAETGRRAPSPATASTGNDARTKTFTYDAVGATPHVEVRRPQTGVNAPMPQAVR